MIRRILSYLFPPPTHLHTYRGVITESLPCGELLVYIPRLEDYARVMGSGEAVT